MKVIPRKDLREFVDKCFGQSELLTFCFDYFHEVYEEINDSMGKGWKITKLIDYCEKRELTKSLYRALAKERQTPFEKRFPEIFDEVFLSARMLDTVTTRTINMVFVSHSNENSELARELAGRIRTEGWEVWIAPDSIPSGVKWIDAIEWGLKTCGVFILLISPSAIQSRWVNKEMNIALELEEKGEIKILPILIEDCEVPSKWNKHQRVSFEDGYVSGVWKTLSALKEVGKNQLYKPFTPFQLLSNLSEGEDLNSERLEILWSEYLNSARSYFVSESTLSSLSRIELMNYGYFWFFLGEPEIALKAYELALDLEDSPKGRRSGWVTIVALSSKNINSAQKSIELYLKEGTDEPDYEEYSEIYTAWLETVKGLRQDWQDIEERFLGEWFFWDLRSQSHVHYELALALASTGNHLLAWKALQRCVLINLPIQYQLGLVCLPAFKTLFDSSGHSKDVIRWFNLCRTRNIIPPYENLRAVIDQWKVRNLL